MKTLRNMRNWIRLHLSFQDANTMPIVGEGLFASLVLYLSNPFYQLFAGAMGASNTAIGMINALPALFSVIFLIPVSSYVDQLREKKPFVLQMIVLCGAILPLAALSPFLGAVGSWVFIVIISIWNIPYYCYTASWQSYFSDLFSPRERSMPYAWRTMANNVAGTICVLVGGLALTYLCKTPAQKGVGYQVLFILAGLIAILQYKMLKKTTPPVRRGETEEVEEPVALREEKPRFMPLKPYRLALQELRKNKAYRFFLLTLFFFYFMWQVGWPLYYIYLVRTAGYSEMVKLGLDALTYVTLAFSATVWGRLMNRWDPRLVIPIGMVGCALGPFLTVSAGSVWFIGVAYIIAALFQPAFQMGLFQYMLRLIPDENKTLNIGIYNTMIQVSGFIAPMIGVAIANSQGAAFAMYIAALCRISSAILFFGIYFVQKKRDKPLGQADS